MPIGCTHHIGSVNGRCISCGMIVNIKQCNYNKEERRLENELSKDTMV